MTYFNFALQTPDAISKDMESRVSLFQELEAWGHLCFAADICALMTQQNLQSFRVVKVDQDNADGYFVGVKDYIFSPPKTPHELDYYDPSFLNEYLRASNYAVEGGVAILLEPENYESKIFYNNIDNVMSHICTPEIYQLWQVLSSKSALEQEIAPGNMVNSAIKKPDFKI